MQNQIRDDYQTYPNTGKPNTKYTYCFVKYKGWQQTKKTNIRY